MQIQNLQTKIESLSASNRRLRVKYKTAMKRIMHLSEALSTKVIGRPNESLFTEIPGYPGREQLQKYSAAGYKSDYVFIKLLMVEIWPEGLAGRSVTGRISTNPYGRGLHHRNWQNNVETKTALEPDKVEYVAGKYFFLFLCFF